MVKQLNLEEQEQIDELKHFWKQYGNLIMWLLIVVFGSIAAWNGYQYWQRSRAVQVAGLFDEVERFAQADDLPRLEQAFTDMKAKYGSMAYAHQAGLLLAKTAHEKGNTDTAKAALQWVADNALDEGYQAIARLRLSGVLLQAKAYDEALKAIAGSFPPSFAGLVADRQGDIYALQGQRAQAVAAYNKAYAELDVRSEYRRMVEIKLTSLGAEPVKSVATAATTGDKK